MTLAPVNRWRYNQRKNLSGLTDWLGAIPENFGVSISIPPLEALLAAVIITSGVIITTVIMKEVIMKKMGKSL